MIYILSTFVSPRPTLSTDKYLKFVIKTFVKPLNKPLFIHKDSIHPKAIRVEIPRNVCKRLSNNSSNEKILNNAKPPYEEALKMSGHENVELKFIPEENTDKHKKKNKPEKDLFCNLLNICIEIWGVRFDVSHG